MIMVLAIIFKFISFLNFLFFSTILQNSAAVLCQTEPNYITFKGLQMKNTYNITKGGIQNSHIKCPCKGLGFNSANHEGISGDLTTVLTNQRPGCI